MASVMTFGPDPNRKAIQLSGRFLLTEPGQPRRTCGKFSGWMRENQATLKKYFEVDLFPGSLNVQITSTLENLHQELDLGHLKPAFVIPQHELRAMATGLGDGQAWRARLSAELVPHPHDCWIFRRVGSRVPRNVVEVLSVLPIVKTFGVRHGQELELTLLEGS